MDDAKLIAEMLQTYGGWGISVIFLFMIVYLYKTMNSLLEKRNDQFIEVLREGTAILKENSEKSERVEEMLRSVARLMETVDVCLKTNHDHIMAAEKTLREVAAQAEVNRLIGRRGKDGR